MFLSITSGGESKFKENIMLETTCLLGLCSLSVAKYCGNKGIVIPQLRADTVFTLAGLISLSLRHHC